ncbi:MAG: hypothetical protein FJZ16_00155 [Candidatus Omnitrophica bacterium]|nr:hypothetical protein [Candidatus Omnitrophota bacterium]
MSDEIRGIKSFSLKYQGIRRKIMTTFALVSVLPMLTAFYMIGETILSLEGGRLFRLIFFLTVIISVLGLLLLMDIFRRIIALNEELSRRLAENITEQIKVMKRDEIEKIRDVVNLLLNR